MDKTIEMAKDILRWCCGDVDDDVYKVLADYVGYPLLINYKREQNYELSDLDLDYLVDVMNRSVSRIDSK